MSFIGPLIRIGTTLATSGLLGVAQDWFEDAFSSDDEDSEEYDDEYYFDSEDDWW